MAVKVDDRGRVTVENGPEVRGLQGRTFRRREPHGDAADVVVVGGAIDVGNADVGPIPELCISSATFGELIDGEAVTTIDLDVFARDYSEMDGAAIALIRAEQVAASIEDTKSAEAAAVAGEVATWRLYR